LLIYPKKVESNNEFVIETISSEPSYIVEDSRIVWALCLLPETFRKEVAINIWSGEQDVAQDADDIWDFVIQEGLVQPAGSSSILRRYKQWEKIGWPVAGIYHEATRDYPFLDMSRQEAFFTDNQRMKNYESGWHAPPVYQEFTSISSTPLLKLTSPFGTDTLKSVSRNHFDKIGLILDLCFGERNHLEHTNDEHNFLQLESLRKAVPSGGGRHPTEVFLTILSPLFGLEPGLYHYNVQNNSLDLLQTKDVQSKVESCISASYAQQLNKPDAYVFFSSLCERAMWRYRDPRSWRAFIIDIGHAQHFFETVCLELGYKCLSLNRIDEINTSRLIGLDPLCQPVLASTALYAANISDDE
jgi:SagB-type dehydrogenase family enzyme